MRLECAVNAIEKQWVSVLHESACFFFFLFVSLYYPKQAYQSCNILCVHTFATGMEEFNVYQCFAPHAGEFHVWHGFASHMVWFHGVQCSLLFFVSCFPKSIVVIAFVNVHDIVTVGRGMVRLSLPLQDNPMLLGQPSPNRNTKNKKMHAETFFTLLHFGFEKGGGTSEFVSSHCRPVTMRRGGGFSWFLISECF